MHVNQCFSSYAFVSFVVFCIIHQILSSEIELDLEIPWPSGIYIDAVKHSNGDIYRFGRLRHSMVSIRPPWANIHVVEEVFSVAETQNLIKKAEQHAIEHGWSKNRHIDYHIRPTRDLSVSSFLNESDYQSLLTRLTEKLYPKYKQRYSLRPSLLHMEDLFLTKYESLHAETSLLAPHQDKNPWSFVIALNDDFDGGGTYFPKQGKNWKMPEGAALIFHGYQLHGAYRITKGSRYILAGFLEYGNSSHEQFLTLYDPTYDGQAALHGFRTGDLIIGMEECLFQEKKKTREKISSSANQSDEEKDVSSATISAAEQLVDVAAVVTAAGDEQAVVDVRNKDKKTCTQDDGTEEELVATRMVEISFQMTEEEWTRIAQSCEQIAPQHKTKFRVRRFVKDEDI